MPLVPWEVREPWFLSPVVHWLELVVVEEQEER